MAEEGGSADSQTANRARVLAVLGAIATGVGVIGFVTVVGGAVLWIRFNAVAIPADKAVAAIPSGELVAVGLATLLPYIGLGLVVVFLAFLFAADNIVPTAPATDIAERWARDAVGQAPQAAPVATPTEQGALSPTAVEAIGATEGVTRAADAADSAAKLGSAALAEQHRDQAKAELSRASDAASLAAGSLKDASIEPDELRAEAEAALNRAEAAVQRATQARKVGVRVRVVGAGVLLVALELVIAVWGGVPPFGHLLLLALVGALLAAAAVTVGWRTRGFALFGASLFLAVLLFGTARTLFRTWDHPKLQPVALIRSGPDRGMTGYYIAETSERVYLARVDAQRVLRGKSFEEALPRIIIVPRGSVVEIAIGALMERRAGLREAAQLLAELCSEKVAEAASAPAAKGACPSS
jgi:hypothetical protein